MTAYRSTLVRTTLPDPASRGAHHLAAAATESVLDDPSRVVAYAASSRPATPVEAPASTAPVAPRAGAVAASARQAVAPAARADLAPGA